MDATWCFLSVFTKSQHRRWNWYYNLPFILIFLEIHSHPFSDQDPVSLGPAVVQSAKDALTIRYSLLPYLYTLFVKAHLHGHPVLTPTYFHAHPGDKLAYEIDHQFFWGSALLVVPVLEEDSQQVNAYLPSGNWYDFRTMKEIHSEIPGFVSLEVPLNYIPILAKGGHILPTQAQGAKTTKQSQSTPFHLKVFLDENESAHGDLYW